MKKKSFKKVFSKMFVASMVTFALSNSVNALSVVEKTSTNDIEEGTVVIGVTKFTPNTILTSYRNSVAATNDMKFHNYAPDYVVPDTYYYDFGVWYKLDQTTGGDSKVTDSETLAKLNSRDVYYINNEPKTFPISYKTLTTIPEGEKLVVVATDKSGNETEIEYDANSSTIKVPATAEGVRIYRRDNDATSGGVLLDQFTRKYDITDESEFTYTNDQASTGVLSADTEFTSASNIKVSGNSATVNGVIPWSNKTNIGAGESGTGHRIGVKIALPNGTDKSNPTDLANNISVTVKSNKDEEDAVPTVYRWEDKYTDEDYSFRFTPIVEAGEVYTVVVAWSADVSQTFTITVAGTLEEKPAGTIAGETIYVKDKDGKDTTEVELSASASADTLTFTGKQIAWDGGVVVMVTPNEYYSSDKNYVLSRAGVTASTKQLVNDEWEDVTTSPAKTTAVVDGKNALVIPLTFAENTATTKGREIELKIDWLDGYVQTFKVVLDDSVNFVYPSLTLKSVKTNDGTADADHIDADYKDGDTVVLGSRTKIAWDKAKGGNLVNVEFKLDEAYDSLKDNLTLRVNGKNVTKTVDGKEENLTFDDLTPADTYSLVVDKDVYTVEVLWNAEKVINTFKIDVTNARLLEAEQGSIALTADYATDNNLSGTLDKTDTITVYSEEYDTGDDDADGNNIMALGQIPYGYVLGGNYVTIELKNTEYNDEVSATGKVTYTVNGQTTEAKVDANGAYDIKVVKGATTTVTVNWDSMNSQTFSIVADKDAEFAKKETGKIYVGADDTNATNVMSYQRDDDDSVTSDDLKWATSTIEKGANGYILSGVTIKPAEAGLTIGDNASLTIRGGHYSDGSYILESKSIASKFNSGKLTLDPIVTAANETLEIDVVWSGEYKEHYTIRVEGADLTNDKASDITVGTAKVKTGTLIYSDTMGTLSADEKYHVLDAALDAGVDTDDIESITVTDAMPGVDDNGKKTESRKLVLASDVSADKKFKLYFTTNSRKANIVIKWTDGYVQNVTVDATTAKIPTINLSSVVKEDGGAYYVDAKVGETINLVQSVSPVGYDYAVAVASGSNNNGKLEAGKDILTIQNNEILATSVGSVNVEVTADNAKTYTVTINVVPDEVVTVSNMRSSIASGKATVTANVSGGYFKNYSGTAEMYQLQADGRYDQILDTVNVKVANGVVTAEFNSTAAVEILSTNNYKFKFDIKDTGYSLDSLASLNAVAYHETNPVKYTVTFDSNGGTAVDSQVFYGEDTPKLVAPVAPTRADEMIKDVKYTYTFSDWYLASDILSDGTLKDGASAFSGFNSAVGKSMTLKAYWTSAVAKVKVTIDGTESEVEYGKTITADPDKDYFVVNDTNFDSMGNLRNKPVKFDTSTKITEDIELKSFSK